MDVTQVQCTTKNNNINSAFTITAVCPSSPEIPHHATLAFLGQMSLVSPPMSGVLPRTPSLIHLPYYHPTPPAPLGIEDTREPLLWICT